LVTQHMRGSMPAKLSFVKAFSPGIAHEPELLAAVKALAEFRNKLIHPTPRYGKTVDIPPGLAEPFDWGDEIDANPDDLETEFAHLSVHEAGAEDLEAAKTHYATADSFIRKLSLYRPSFLDEARRREPHDP